MIKVFLSYTICLLLAVGSLFSQTGKNIQDDFEEAFYRIYMQTASYDVPQALKSADSLYRVSVSDIHKVRSLMLISDMYHRLSNRDSSIHYAGKAGEIAVSANMYAWQARIYGVLSTQCRETGLIKQGKTYLQKGLQASERIENPDVANQFKGQVYQEKGYYAQEEGKPRDAIMFFKQAEEFFLKLPHSPNLNFFLAQNEERLGTGYQALAMLDSALYHYSNALKYHVDSTNEETPLKGFIYSGLGSVLVAQGNHAEAFRYLEKALVTAEATGFTNLKIGVYKNLSAYYKAVGDAENQLRYYEKYVEIMKENVVRHQHYADNFLFRTQQRLNGMMNAHKTLLIISFFLLLLAITGVGVYMRREKRNYRRFQDVIKKLDENKVPDSGLSTEVAITKEKDIMSEAIKQEILRKLERFESSLQFTDKNISIAVLAGKLKTNTKYLSHIINKYRQKDFNSYINELRVNYIIVKMEKDPRYLNYKISYLADECGFSSHSKFTTIFKNVVGLAPSTFIAYLKKTNSRKKQVA